MNSIISIHRHVTLSTLQNVFQTVPAPHQNESGYHYLLMGTLALEVRNVGVWC